MTCFCAFLAEALLFLGRPLAAESLRMRKRGGIREIFFGKGCKGRGLNPYRQDDTKKKRSWGPSGSKEKERQSKNRNRKRQNKQRKKKKKKGQTKTENSVRGGGR